MPLVLIFLLGVYWLTGQDSLVIYSLAALLLFQLIYQLGKKLIIPETVALYSILIYLLFPLWGYQWYPAHHPLSTLFDLYMRVPREEYFGFALPAITLFILALFWVQRRGEQARTRVLLKAARNRLAEVPSFGLGLIVVGAGAYYLAPLIPSGLQYVFQIAFLSMISGLFYLLFLPDKGFLIKAIIFSCMVWLFYMALQTTMFTLIAYMGLTSIGLFFIGRRLSIPLKGFIFSGILVLGLVTQFTKANYRMLIRGKLAQSGDIRVFANLFFENLKNMDQALLDGALFPIYMRGNQGYLLSRVMEHIPARKAHDHGKVLGKSILASLVPRMVWANKPEAGGKLNMAYYANKKMGRTSMNVGPIGEGYGAFGKWGGMAYMFLFGGAIGLANRIFLYSCERLPLLLFWQPLIFFEVVYCMENDSMQAFNSLIKTAFLLFILYKIYPPLFKGKPGERTWIYEKGLAPKFL